MSERAFSIPFGLPEVGSWFRIGDGKTFEVPSGVSLTDALLDHGVDIEHACGKVAACTTCHCIVRKGFASLPPAEDKEEDLLDRAWGLTPVSRLSCQAIVSAVDHGTARRPYVDPDQLQTAGEKAAERRIGDSFVFDRSCPVPLSPLISWTVARSLLSEKPKEDFFAY